MIEAEPISGTDLGLRETLVAANLPVSDLDAEGRLFFRFADDGAIVAYGGLEPYGDVALLRSVVVTGSLRGTGKGRRVTERLIELARGLGVTDLYLLTETAEHFFAHLGFRHIARSEAPPSILATEQAASICTSAAMLTRSTG